MEKAGDDSGQPYVSEPLEGSRQQDRQQSRELPIPDGGYGWVCVFGQFLVNGFTWGSAAAYAVYLSWYLSHNLFPDAKDIDFAVIGGLNFTTAVVVAPLATIAVRLLGLRGPMLLGCLILPSGYIGASFATKTWHLYPTQGIMVGLGIGLIYIPATAVIPQWFSSKRSLANGICAAGSGIGGCAMCFATQAMLESVGVQWALRITAVVVFFVNFAATLLMRSRNAEVQPSLQMFDYRLFGSYQVNLLLLWSFTIMFGYIVLMFSLPDYAKTIGQSSTNSGTVAAILNLGAAVGRPAIGFASDKFGRVETTAILTIICSILCYAMWIPASDYATLVAFALLSGAILGVFWAAISPLAAEVVELKSVPSLLSLTWLTVASPAAVAEVITLQIKRPNASRVYLYPQVFAGTSYLLASIFIFELWRSRRKRTKQQIGTEDSSIFADVA